MKNPSIFRNTAVWHPIYEQGTAICYLEKQRKWLVFFRQSSGPQWVGENHLETYH